MRTDKDIMALIEQYTEQVVLPEDVKAKYNKRVPMIRNQNDCLNVIEQIRNAASFDPMDAFKKRFEVELEAELRHGDTDVIRAAHKSVLLDDSLTVRGELEKEVAKITANRYKRSLYTVEILQAALDAATPRIEASLKAVLQAHGLVWLQGVKDNSLKEDKWSKLNAMCDAINEINEFRLPQAYILDMRLKIAGSIYGFRSSSVVDNGIKVKKEVA